MGHQFSKAEDEVPSSRPSFRRAPQKFLDNDGMSGATEITYNSISPPLSSHGTLRQSHTGTWKRDAAPIGDASLHTTSRSTYAAVGNQSHSMNPAHRSWLPRRDSDPGFPAHSERGQRRPDSIPVPKRHRLVVNSTTGCSDADSVSSDHCQEASYLERIYDARTWEMYRRITEARRLFEMQYSTKATDRSAKTTSDPRQGSKPSYGDETSEWENLQNEEEAFGESQHEMVFSFDF